MNLTLATPKKNSRSMRAVTLLAVFLAACLAGLVWYFSQTVTLNGQARANVISLGPAMGGVVDAVLVRPGDPVDAGETLLMMDNRRLREQLLKEQETLLLRQAAVPPQKMHQKTALAGAGAAPGVQGEDPVQALEKRLKELRKAEVEAGELVRESSALEARAAYVRNQASARAARGQAPRTQVNEAERAHYLARKTLDEAKITFEEHSLARARVEADVKRLREARQQPSQEDKAGDVLLKSYEVQLERVRLAEENLAAAKLTTPEAGIVAAVLAEPGMEVFTGQRVIYLLPRESRPRIMAFATESEASRIFVNTPCRVRVPLTPGGPFTGVVEAVYPAARELQMKDQPSRDPAKNMVVQVRLTGPENPGQPPADNATLDAASLPMIPEGAEAFVEFSRR